MSMDGVNIGKCSKDEMDESPNATSKRVKKDDPCVIKDAQYREAEWDEESNVVSYVRKVFDARRIRLQKKSLSLQYFGAIFLGLCDKYKGKYLPGYDPLQDRRRISKVEGL